MYTLLSTGLAVIATITSDIFVVMWGAEFSFFQRAHRILTSIDLYNVAMCTCVDLHKYSLNFYSEFV